MKRVFYNLAALSLALGMIGPVRADYDFTTLDVPGATRTNAHGVNNAGQIVGSYGDATGTHGFVATPN